MTSSTDPWTGKGRLKALGGSGSDQWNNVVANQAVQALWQNHGDEEERDRRCQAALAGLMGIAPRDELEGMMAAQIIAAHNAAMECYRRAMIGPDLNVPFVAADSTAEKVSSRFSRQNSPKGSLCWDQEAHRVALPMM